MNGKAAKTATCIGVATRRVRLAIIAAGRGPGCRATATPPGITDEDEGKALGMVARVSRDPSADEARPKDGPWQRFRVWSRRLDDKSSFSGIVDRYVAQNTTFSQRLSAVEAEVSSLKQDVRELQRRKDAQS